jgi:hypothetical protein
VSAFGSGTQNNFVAQHLGTGATFVPSRQFLAAVLLIFQYSAWADSRAFSISLEIHCQKITKKQSWFGEETIPAKPYISGIMLNTV